MTSFRVARAVLRTPPRGPAGAAPAPPPPGPCSRIALGTGIPLALQQAAALAGLAQGALAAPEGPRSRPSHARAVLVPGGPRAGRSSVQGRAAGPRAGRRIGHSCARIGCTPGRASHVDIPSCRGPRPRSSCVPGAPASPFDQSGWANTGPRPRRARLRSVRRRGRRGAAAQGGALLEPAEVRPAHGGKGETTMSASGSAGRAGAATATTSPPSDRGAGRGIRSALLHDAPESRACGDGRDAPAAAPPKAAPTGRISPRGGRSP